MKLISELWKDIEGLEGVYQISSKGNLRSPDRWIIDKNGKRKFLKAHPIKVRPQYSDGTGYIQANLRVNGRYVMFLVHRLVAKAFIPNPKNLEQVNHKDENKQNNDVNNLEWLSRLDNTRYGTGIDRMAEKHSTAIVQLDMNGSLIKEWRSMRKAENNIENSAVRACIHYKRNIYDGYFWMKLKDYNNMTEDDVKQLIKKKAEEKEQKKNDAKERAKRTFASANKKAVVQLNIDGSFVKEWDSACSAAKEGYSAGDIRACVRGEQKTSRGYKWMDLEEYKKSQEKLLK